MDIGTIIDPITNKWYEAYFTRHYWFDTSDFRYNSTGGLAPAGTEFEVIIRLENLVMTVQDYFRNPMTKDRHPLIVKFDKQTWLGFVQWVGTVDHNWDTVVLNIRLQEVTALEFSERIDDIINDRG